jgi:ATP-dependent Zn protease
LDEYEPISIERIQAAHKRISDIIVRARAGAAKAAFNIYALKDPIAKMAVGMDGTYLTKGLYSDKGRKQVEEEIEKIKNKALSLALDIIRNHNIEIKKFVENHLVDNQTLVRSEIIDILNGMGIEQGSYYKSMCKALIELGFLV